MSEQNIPMSPEEAVLDKLEVVERTTSETVVRFSCPEFTSMCPILKQPDFARIYIDYIPDKWLVESKSLKFYLGSFRNHNAYHEECAGIIAQRLVALLNPKWLRVTTFWYPRGGIPIDTFFQTGIPPDWAVIPTLDINQLYAGR